MSKVKLRTKMERDFNSSTITSIGSISFDSKGYSVDEFDAEKVQFLTTFKNSPYVLVEQGEKLSDDDVKVFNTELRKTLKMASIPQIVQTLRDAKVLITEEINKELSDDQSEWFKFAYEKLKMS